MTSLHAGRRRLQFVFNLCPQLQAARGIHLAYSYGSATDWCQAVDPHFLEAEMIVPVLRARVEERSNLSGFIIDASEIGSFVKAASVARQSKIGSIIVTTVLTGTYMVDVKGSEWRIALA